MEKDLDIEQITCPGCGRPVDKLRAGAVAVYETKMVYYCTTDCKSRHLGSTVPSRPPPPATRAPQTEEAETPATTEPSNQEEEVESTATRAESSPPPEPPHRAPTPVPTPTPSPKPAHVEPEEEEEESGFAAVISKLLDIFRSL